MTADTADLTRPIVGIKNRTAAEVFDIMCDRIRSPVSMDASATESADPVAWQRRHQYEASPASPTARWCARRVTQSTASNLPTSFSAMTAGPRRRDGSMETSMTTETDTALALRLAEKLERMGVEAVINPPILVRTHEEAHALARILREYAEGWWRPIESAPRDGTRILATGGGLSNAVEIISYADQVGAWRAEMYTLDDRDHEPDGYSRPTHWRPLPSHGAEQ